MVKLIIPGYEHIIHEEETQRGFPIVSTPSTPVEDDDEDTVNAPEEDVPEVLEVFSFTPNRKRARGGEPDVSPVAPPAPKRTKLVSCCYKRKLARLNGDHTRTCFNVGTNEAYLSASMIN